MRTEQTIKNNYTVTAGVLDYAVTFPLYEETDVAVLISSDGGESERLLTLGSEYSVSIGTDRSGGMVRLAEGAASAGDALTLVSALPYTQELDLSNTATISTDQTEVQLDRTTQQIQQLAEQVARSVKITQAAENRGETAASCLDRIYAARDAAQAAAENAGDSATQATQNATVAVDSAREAAASAADAESWARRAEAASPNGPATPERSGSVKPRKGLSIAEDGTLDVNPGKGLVLDSEKNALDVDVSTVSRGVLAVEHGGTGGSTAEEALERLGIRSWQRRMETSTPRRLRQAVLHGREKDGYPAYLVGQEFVNMEHEDGVYHSRRGTVSVSGEYSTSYRGTKPLRNQVVFQSNAWITPNTVTSGWWQYDFADGPHVLTGLFLNGRNNEPSTTPLSWQLLGWNEETSDWEEIYRRDADQELRGSSDNLKSSGRMHWFTDNTKAYQRVRINIDSNHGGNFSQISVIRFYETLLPGLDKYDVALYATPEDAFVATVGGGLAAEAADRVLDIPCRLTAPVIFDGHKLHEMSRNYLYLVPATDDGSLPASLAGEHAQAFTDANGRKFFLYADTRKLHYGTQGDLEKECLTLLQSQHTVDYDPVPDGQFEHSMGALEYPLTFTNVRISTAEPHRGAPSSYHFVGSNNWISPNKHFREMFPQKRMHPYALECTVELDFKWEGPAPDTSDGQYILYDEGSSGAKGWCIAYSNRKKNLMLLWDGGFRYWVPFNAEDKAWHTLAVSLRAGHIYVHVDGTCLGMFDDATPQRPYYHYWMIGRWISANTCSWYGYLNNLRVTCGTALYQGADYAVSKRFYPTRIPDKSLWYDSAEGVVKEYDAAGERWHSLPMLPIGHVDTGRREHLFTDQPRGTYGDGVKSSKYLLPGGITASSYYNASSTPENMFNFGTGGATCFNPTPDNTIDHWCAFALERPMRFALLRLCTGNDDWRDFPCLFRFLGRNPEDVDIVEVPPEDGEGDATTQEVPRWTTLIDRSAFVDDGGPVNDPAALTGEHLHGYKDIPIADQTAFSLYRLEILAKSAVPFYKDRAYTDVKIMPVFRDARPEVLTISSYAIGDTWSIGPLPLTVNTEAEIPVPFANLAFDVSGWVEEAYDIQRKRRRLGTLEGNVTDTGYCGETLYQAADAVIIITGKKYLSIYNGSWWNAGAVNEASTNADYYLICQRRI